MATDPSEYDKAIPIVAAHLAQIERAVSRTRSSHAGQPYTTVRDALVQALRKENARNVVPQVVDEFARRISEEPDTLPF
ncbi:hypothetical protein [Streptomyces sp. NPDC006527]|uniref:hypothetical protein n=1 Tax=Streptomyces sp. NPDC006527 TaxID=3364749 RepID=UPI00367C1C40